jgi:segregation and condensation protein A
VASDAAQIVSADDSKVAAVS